MLANTLARTLSSAAALLAVTLWSQAALAVSYQITVDTGSILDSEGILDLQFNPADPTPGATPAATALVSGFTGLSFLGAPSYEGAASGNLTSLVTFANSGFLNEYYQPVKFGTTFGFNVDFSGDFLNQSSNFGTLFALQLYSPGFTASLLTSDPNSRLVQFDLLQSTISYTLFDQETGPPATSVTAPVPLPAAAWLMLSGLGAMARIARRRNLSVARARRSATGR